MTKSTMNLNTNTAKYVIIIGKYILFSSQIVGDIISYHMIMLTSHDISFIEITGNDNMMSQLHSVVY